MLVNMYGMKERIGVSPQALLTLASFLGLEVKASVNLRAALPGEWLASKIRKEAAARLGRVLFGKKGRGRRVGRAPFAGMTSCASEKRTSVSTFCHAPFVWTGGGGQSRGGRDGMWGARSLCAPIGNG